MFWFNHQHEHQLCGDVWPSYIKLKGQISESDAFIRYRNLFYFIKRLNNQLAGNIESFTEGVLCQLVLFIWYEAYDVSA